MKIKLVSDEKIAETSSKGNQEKWKDGELWYKADQFGYEALSETLISRLLEKSNIEKETPFSFVRYRTEKAVIHGREQTVCVSENFLRKGQSIITLSHLLKKMLGTPVKEQLGRISSDRKRIEYLATKTEEFTGLEQFGEYLTLLFEIDALFYNDDRHLNNIAVIEESGRYSYCPIFDNGASLLSNTRVLQMDIEPLSLIKTLRARPFLSSFTRQMNSARALFGRQLSLDKLTADDIKEELSDILEYYPERDRGFIKDRVCACILTGQKKLNR